MLLHSAYSPNLSFKTIQSRHQEISDYALFFYLYQTLIYPLKIPHFSEFSSAFLTILRVFVFNNSAIGIFYFSLN